MSTEIKEAAERPYEAARAAAYGELMALRHRAETGTALPGDDARELQLLDLIRALATTLSDQQGVRHRSSVAAVPHPGQGRVSEAHGAILQTLPLREKWTSAEVRRALAEQGVNAPAKVVTNCLDYLVKTSRLRRLARGMYYNSEYGVGVVTAQDFGGEPARYEGDYLRYE